MIPNPSTQELDLLKQKLITRHRELLDHPDWVAVRDQKGIQSWMLDPKDGSIPMVKAESVVPCNAEQLFHYLVRDIADTCSEWNDVMYFSEVIKSYEPGRAELTRVIAEGNWVADREDAFFRFMGPSENGNFYEVSEGLDAKAVPIRKTETKYIVRSNMIFCSKEFTPMGENACKYETIWHYDPAGWLSKLLPLKMLAKMISKNLEHEHQKLAEIFGKN